MQPAFREEWPFFLPTLCGDDDDASPARPRSDVHAHGAFGPAFVRREP